MNVWIIAQQQQQNLINMFFRDTCYKIEQKGKKTNFKIMFICLGKVSTIKAGTE